ncbi:hypothetical protein [Thermomonas sp.]|uniref:hypothetical protein n=1 Tax=Thermomonas sp. TaxID=1971895 RepID=UPI002486EA83|nr:hypothetical protein [Thermomonas sp.]MDI1254190.1 hypothetical protein [Thermomonas sp.]
MSIFKKNVLAAALVAGLVLAGSAGAYTVWTGGDLTPETVATQSGATFSMTEAVSVNIDLGDAIIGRTTGFQVKITLASDAFGTGGPKFNNVPNTGAFTLGSATVGGWSSTLAAGGTPGTAIVQYSVQPTNPGSVINNGVLGMLAPLNFATAPANVWATVEIIDPVTGTGLHTKTIQLVTRDDGLAFTCAAQPNPDKIDVGVNGAYPTAKTGFTDIGSSYAIGSANHSTAPLGTISVAATAGFTLNVAPGGDTLTSRVGGDFTSFTNVFLATSNTCATNIGSYTINAAKTQANLSKTFSALNTAGGAFTGAGGSATLCVSVNGTTQVAAQTFTVQNGINGTLEADACDVAPIAYNGSVVQVYHINPAGNSTAQSFVRVINPSNVSGTVTLEGIDDAGVAGATPIKFVLGPKKSMQINSNDLEAGNAAKGLTGAWGDGTGKWRAIVTGEFGNMRVQGLNRNANDGTVTNLTDADGQGEQVWNKVFD